MKGDGEESKFGDFLSLGSSSRSTGSRSGGEREGTSGRAGTSCVGDESLDRSLTMLSSLSRNGLNMLAGGLNGGFSLKPPAVGNLSGMPGLRNLVGGSERTSKVSGSGFTGFYRASVPKTSWPSSPAGMGLRFVREETQGKEEAGPSSSQRASSGIVGEQPLRTDVENLSPDECWRLILKLGKRWPAWNGPTVLPSPQGVPKDKSSSFENLDRGHHSHKDENQGGNPGKLQVGQDPLQLLAKRALEALAETPDRYGRPPRSMLAPKMTTQEFLRTKAARDPPTPPSQSARPTLPVYQQSTSSREMAGPKTSSAEPRTAPLTIFYAGTVNVCDNVPEDKARLIMLFAEKAGIKPTVRAPAPSASCAAPSTNASPQVFPDAVLTPQGSALPQEDLQLSQPSSHPVLVTGTSSVHPHLSHSATHPEDSSSLRKPVDSSNHAEMETAEPPPIPLIVTVTEGKPQRQPQGPAKPLPNARKNSLARFLDSRKRNRPTASGSEGQPSKRPARGRSPSDGCPSDADDMGRGKSPMPLRSQSSIDSKEGSTAMFSDDAEMKSNDSVTK